MMEITKREWILVLLRHRPLDRIRLMKALFLIWHRSGRKLKNFYQFVPYLYGPCSFELYKELESLQRDHLITQPLEGPMQWVPYFLTGAGRDRADTVARKLDQTTSDCIANVVKEVSSLGFRALLRKVYSEAPDFAGQSVIRRLGDDPHSRPTV